MPDVRYYHTIRSAEAGSGSCKNGYIKLVFLRARWYQPKDGRFLSQDTIVPDFRDPPSIHRYFYVENNPVNLVDPTGHQSCNYELGCTTETINGVWVEWVSRKKIDCWVPPKPDLFLPFPWPHSDWEIGQRIQMTNVFGGVLRRIYQRTTIASGADFMTRMGFSRQKPLLLARAEGSIPGQKSTLAAARWPGGDLIWIYDPFFDMVNSDSKRVFHLSHEIAHLWDMGQNYYLSEEFNRERKQHGFFGIIDPNNLVAKRTMMNTRWYYGTEYAKANWFLAREDWAETVAWILRGGVPEEDAFEERPPWSQHNERSTHLAKKKMEWVKAQINR